MKATLIIEDDGKPDEFNLDLRANEGGAKLPAVVLQHGMESFASKTMDSIVQTFVGKSATLHPVDFMDLVKRGVKLSIGELNLIGTHQLNSTQSN